MKKVFFANTLAQFVQYAVSALFIWWGWLVLAPHLNCPIFSYVEIFAMRMMLSSVMYIFWQKGVK